MFDRKAYKHQYQLNHKEEQRQYNHQWYLDHRDEVSKRSHQWYLDHSVWVICPICQKGRWRAKAEIKRDRRPNSSLNRCHHCAVALKGAECVNWKGGRHIDKEGYILVWLSPDDFFYPMANKQGYTREHRLVIAKKLGRCLHRWELVHHKGIRFKGIKNRSDNLEDNLQLVSDERHNQITILEKRIAYLESKLLSVGIKP